MLLGSDGEYADLPDTTVHGLALESEMLLEPDSRTVNNAEVRGSTGVEAQGWRDSMETEFHKNFVERNVFFCEYFTGTCVLRSPITNEARVHT